MKLVLRTANFLANYRILSYLIRYPLFSYKYRSVPVQLELLKLSKNYKLEGGLVNLEGLKLKSKAENLSFLRLDDKLKSHYNHIANKFPFNSW
jgi:hypothetical protein